MAHGVSIPMAYAHERYFGRPSCPKCGEMIMAPESSDHFVDRKIRHIWLCEGCDFDFETSVELIAKPSY